MKLNNIDNGNAVLITLDDKKIDRRKNIKKLIIAKLNAIEMEALPFR